MGTENRKFYFDYLRILATLAVIAIHIVASPWQNVYINSTEWIILNFFSGMSRWAVPIFVMISGALFLNPQKEISIKSIYTKNIFRIVIAFIFWSVFYAAVNYSSPLEFMSAVLEGHYHLWFCFMIVGLYIIVPLLRQFTKSKFITKYFLIVAFIFTFLIPDIIRELQQQVYSDLLLELGASLSKIFEDTYFNFTLGFTAFFIAGYYFNVTKLSKKAKILTYILGIYGLFASVFFTYLYSIYYQKPSENYYNSITTHILFAAIGVFCFAKYELGKIKLSKKMQKAVKALSKYSFGIYLIHPMVIGAFKRIGLSALSFNPIFSVPLMIILVFIISLVISAVLNNIPFIKKYIV